MPRALPWATNGSAKQSKAAVKIAKPAARHSNDNAPEDDLVNSDLDAIHPKKPEKKEPVKKRFRASSSSPPPPGPPPVERIKPGFAADDIFMMVEDEFYSTAQLYTGHIHHAEYARLKKLHKSRGQEILAGLGRGTDGKTEQSKALRTKMESLELAKKQKQVLKKVKADANDDSDDEGSAAEDEYMQDPHLAGLMRASQMAPSQDLSGLASPKANTRAAAGYSQSPYKETRTKDVFAEEKQQRRRSRMANIDEREEDPDGFALPTGAQSKYKAKVAAPYAEESETDSDDLDAGVPEDTERTAISAWANKVVAPASSSRTKTKPAAEMPRAADPRPSASFARPPDKRSTTEVRTDRFKAHAPKEESQAMKNAKLSGTSVKREPIPSPNSTRLDTLPTPPRERKYISTLARKRAERAAADAKQKTIKKEDIDDIPTFLF